MVCQQKLMDAGKPYPRTCPECGLGPCKYKTIDNLIDKEIIQLKLLDLSYDYFGPLDNLNGYIDSVKDNDTLCYVLATYLFDNDAEFNTETFELLSNIERIFGKNIKEKTLDNLFTGNHDT